MNEEIEKVAKYLENVFRNNWHKEPEDVKRLRTGQVKGVYNQIATPILYAESETREMVDYLWLLIDLIKGDKCDIDSARNTIISFLEYKLNKWTAWYKMEEIRIVFQEVILAIGKSTTKEEILSLLVPLQMFISKVNFWLDASIPWLTLTTVFEINKLDK